MLDLSRRNFLIRASVFVAAAPAIVRAASLMPVKSIDDWHAWVIGFDAYGNRFEDVISVTKRQVEQNLMDNMFPNAYVQIYKTLPTQWTRRQ